MATDPIGPESGPQRALEQVKAAEADGEAKIASTRRAAEESVQRLAKAREEAVRLALVEAERARAALVDAARASAAAEAEKIVAAADAEAQGIEGGAARLPADLKRSVLAKVLEGLRP